MFKILSAASFEYAILEFSCDRSVAANFEVTAYSKLAAGKISNMAVFDFTYVYSNIHGHFVV